MSYYIYRGQQQYGPYTLQDLQRYVAEGSITSADQARDETSTDWTTVAQILAAPTYTPAPQYPPQQPSVYAQPSGVPVPLNPYAQSIPLPPNLHWALVLLISVVFNPFQLGWMLYQMIWIRNIDKQSKAILYFVIGLVIPLILMVVGAAIILTSAHATGDSPATGASILAVLCFTLAWLIAVLFVELAYFNMRRSLLQHYNTVEPIQLRLSGVMTFFFNLYYFQYHMSRIAAWKQTGYLNPQV
jgi:hypothetical protein